MTSSTSHALLLQSLHPYPTRRSSDLNQFPEESRLSANSSKGLLSSVPGNCSMREAISRFSSTSTVPPNVSSLAVNNEKLPSYQSTLRSEEHTSELQSLTNIV